MRPPISGSSSRTGASCTRTATGCSGSVQDAEDALQDALLRAWKALDRFEGRSSAALLAVPDRDQRLPGRARAPPEARAADRPTTDAPAGETVWLEPYPDDARRRGLRAAREHRAGVHRRAAAPAGQPARGADPARGARLQRQGGRGDARHDARLGQQRDAARAGGGRRARCRSARSRRRCARSATTRSARWSSATSTPGTAATSTRSSRCSPRRRRSRCRRTSQWFRGREAIREFLPTGPLSIPRIFVPARANGQLAFGTYKLIDGEWSANAIHVHHAGRGGRDHRRGRVPGRRRCSRASGFR